MALACLAVSLQGCGQAVIGVTSPHLGWQITRPFDMVMALAVDRDTVWVGTKNGVYAVDGKTGTVIKKLETDPPLDYVKALLVDHAGELYIGHFNGLTVFDANGYRTYTKKDGLPDNRVNALLEDRDGRLWVGTWGGIGILENGKWRTLTSADGLITDMVNVMLQDSSGGMWFGSMVAPRGGISYLKDGRWQLFSTNNGLPHNNINALIEDNSGNVWAGTGLLDRGGAVCFAPTEKGWSITKGLAEKGRVGRREGPLHFPGQRWRDVVWLGVRWDCPL